MAKPFTSVPPRSRYGDLLDAERVKWAGFDWHYDGPGMGKGGTGTLKADGVVLDSHPMQHCPPISVMWHETFNVGLDTGTPVDDQDCQLPFRFTGTIDKLTIKLGPTQLTSNDHQVIQYALASAHD